MTPLIYLDTNIFKFSATSQRRLIPYKKISNVGGVTYEDVFYDLKLLNSNDRIKNNDHLRREAELLKDVAQLAKKQKVRFVISLESQIEFLGLVNADSTTGRFYGVPYKIVDPPIKYSRMVMAPFMDMKDEQYKFLTKINHPRFIQLQKWTGAYQGKNKINQNQLVDAFHIWCAEYNGCTHFLTLDLKLIREMKKHQKEVSVSFIKPSELIELLTTPFEKLLKQIKKQFSFDLG